MNLFCKHDWKILSEVTTESKLEQLLRLGAVIKTTHYYALERKHITTVTCTKCGKLKQFVEEI